MDCSLIAATFSWFSLDSWIGMFWMAIGLGFIIFVHELGHFLAAKSCGVKVEAFYVGFNVPFPKLFGVTIIPQYLLKFQIGETEYGIGNLPLGGYVKMLGQEDTPAKPEEDESAEPAAESGGEEDGPVEAPHHEQLDPRDYRAKSVLQRFWIISAGVIMNLLTAPLFAMLAFLWGVPEIPARIGYVLPAGPAYRADFRPGDRVVQIGETEATSAVTFSDFAEANALAGTANKAVHYIQREPGGEPIRKEVQPSNDVLKIKYRTIAAIGAGPDLSTRLAKSNAVVPGSAADQATPPLENGDLILSVNGQPVEYGSDLKQLIAANNDRPFQMEVARLGNASRAEVTPETERLTITVPPRKKKTVGLVMEMSEIIAVQPNSPAEEAGLSEGDELLTLEGEPIGDPLTLPMRIRQLSRDQPEIELGIRTAEGQETTVLVKPRMPYARVIQDNAPISIDELGVAVRVLNEVAAVEPGSSADQAGIRPGDQIIQAEFVPQPADREKEIKDLGMPPEPIDLTSKPYNWPAVDMHLQNRLPETSLKLKIDRNDEPVEVTLNWSLAEDEYSEIIGIQLSQDQVIKQASSIGEAFQFGMKQVTKDAGRIYTFLQALITGQVSATTMGGPLTIGNVAVSFAQENMGKFLSFLAFISVNLAIVNFLPIPVLDGGHAVFLIWEGVTGKPVNENSQYIATLIGFVFLLSLMLFVFSLDILTFFF